jgi:hypothetical protein
MSHVTKAKKQRSVVRIFLHKRMLTPARKTNGGADCIYTKKFRECTGINDAIPVPYHICRGGYDLCRDNDQPKTT